MKLFITEATLIAGQNDKEIVVEVLDVYLSQGYRLVFVPDNWECIKLYPELKKEGTRVYLDLNERHSFYTH